MIMPHPAHTMSAPSVELSAIRADVEVGTPSNSAVLSGDGDAYRRIKGDTPTTARLTAPGSEGEAHTVLTSSQDRQAGREDGTQGLLDDNRPNEQEEARASRRKLCLGMLAAMGVCGVVVMVVAAESIGTPTDSWRSFTQREEWFHGQTRDHFPVDPNHAGLQWSQRFFVIDKFWRKPSGVSAVSWSLPTRPSYMLRKARRLCRVWCVCIAHVHALSGVCVHVCVTQAQSSSTCVASTRAGASLNLGCFPWCLLRDSKLL